MKQGWILVAILLSPGVAYAQRTVCDLFKDLKASDGRRLTVSGDLIISKDIAVLGAADCDNEYLLNSFIWPRGLRLRPSNAVPAEQLALFRAAAEEADRIRATGRTVTGTASFQGQVHVKQVGDMPAELVFDAVKSIHVTALPAAETLPVIPICELFQNLAKWKGQRIAVRGIESSTFEGTWLWGDCQGKFVTDGYRWPVGLAWGGPAYYAAELEPLLGMHVEPTKIPEGLRGGKDVVTTETWVGRLRMRSHYLAICQDGRYWGNGFGHLNAAVAELVVDAIRDGETSEQVESEEEGNRDEEPQCSASAAAQVWAWIRLLIHGTK